MAWIAHAYTATGTVWALLATAMTFAHNFRAAFIFLVVAVFVDSTDGVLAQQVLLPESAWVPSPDGVDPAAAATVPCAGVTAWHALFGLGALPPGASVALLGTGTAFSRDGIHWKAAGGPAPPEP